MKQNSRMDALDFLYQNLTKSIYFGLGDEDVGLVSDLKRDCDGCGCSASSYGGIGWDGLNSYKEKRTYCKKCHAFFTSNPKVMGVENPRKPTTSQKWGMLLGTGCLIDSNGKVVVFTPKKSFDKFPSDFTQTTGAELIVMSSKKQIIWIAKNQNNLTYPLLWINDFGRKTPSLISNLRLSLSSESLFVVNDKELNSSTSPLDEINLKTVEFLLGIFKEDRKFFKEFSEHVSKLARGFVSPGDFYQSIKDDDNLIKAVKCLPADPHGRLAIMSIVRSIMES